MSTIESVHVCVARVPLDRVTSFATRTVSARDYCLVKVRSTRGRGRHRLLLRRQRRRPHRRRRGRGAAWRPSSSGRTRIVSRGCGSRCTPSRCCRAAAAPSCARSASSTRRCGISTRARRSLPLYKYTWAAWWPTACPPTRAAATTSTARRPRGSARSWPATSGDGFTAVKMKVGRLSPARGGGADQGRARGDRARRPADAGRQQRLARPADGARSTCERYEAVRSLLDRGAVLAGRDRPPRAPGATHRHDRSRRARSPMAAGTTRSCWTRVARRSCRPTPCVCGGITEWRRIAATAASYGVTVSPHWFHDLHAPSGRGDAQRALRRVLSRRPGAQFPPADRHAAPPRERCTCRCRRRPGWVPLRRGRASSATRSTRRIRGRRFAERRRTYKRAGETDGRQEQQTRVIAWSAVARWAPTSRRASWRAAGARTS